MHKLLLAAAASTTVAVCLAGCSAAPSRPALASDGVPPNSARIVVDGRDLGITDAVCTQVGWTWTISTGDDISGVTAVIETGGGPLTARSVRFRQVDGFSGSYWDDNHGTAEASIVEDNWTVTGDIEGFNIESDGIDHGAREYTISANC